MRKVKKIVGALILLTIIGGIFTLTAMDKGFCLALTTWLGVMLITSLLILGVKWVVD